MENESLEIMMFNKAWGYEMRLTEDDNYVDLLCNCLQASSKHRYRDAFICQYMPHRKIYTKYLWNKTALRRRLDIP